MTPQFVYISAERYALGRMTYIVSETVDWLITELPNIEPKTLEVLRRDVNDALTSGRPYAYGAEMDKKQWERFMEATKHEGKTKCPDCHGGTYMPGNEDPANCETCYGTGSVARKGKTCPVCGGGERAMFCSGPCHGTGIVEDV